MSGSSSPSVPEQQPRFFAGQGVGQNITFMNEIARDLIGGDFSRFPQLLDAVNVNDELTRSRIGLASRDVIEAQKLSKQNTLNALEANNQLTSSVTANRLADLDESFASDIADITTGFFIEDMNRALNTRQALFGVGLDTLNQATAQGQALGQRRTAFDQERFENEFSGNILQSQGGFNGQGAGSALGMGLGFLAGGPIGAGIGGAIGGGIGGSLFPGGTGAAQSGALVSGLGGVSQLAGLSQLGGRYEQNPGSWMDPSQYQRTLGNVG